MTNEQLKILRQFLSDLTSADIYSPLILSNERSPGEELIPILRAVIEGASAVEPSAPPPRPNSREDIEESMALLRKIHRENP